VRLVLASGNPDKLAEVRAILADTALEILPVTAVIPGWDCEETGDTIEENAAVKALAAARATSMPCIADDTGLFVPALGGAPGVYSARYAGSSAGYADNVAKLLRVLKWEEGASRRAFFRTAAAFVRPGGHVIMATGEVEGVILDEPAGSGGFGYDPVFFVPSLGCTYAECPACEKNTASHRARAFMKLASLIPPE
jgi:XTP/dITP diphosphohydrolase